MIIGGASHLDFHILMKANYGKAFDMKHDTIYKLAVSLYWGKISLKSFELTH